MDWTASPYQGKVFVIDLADGTATQTDVACDIYPVWLDNERLLLNQCTSEVGHIYSTDLEDLGEGRSPDYAYTAYVTDETGAIFYSSEFAIEVVEPGTETGTELTRLFTWPGALILVPPSARSDWEGSVFTVRETVHSPPTTFVEAPAPGVSGTDLVDSELPVWLMIVGAVTVGAVFWLMLRPPSELSSLTARAKPQ